jgi:hypothetical protein
MGDTCHHCKGDMWHRMMSAADWEGTVVGYVAGDMDHSTINTWHFVIGCCGATWPSHGLPHGTLWLVDGLCKILYGFTGVEPATAPPGCGLAGPG